MTSIEQPRSRTPRRTRSCDSDGSPLRSRSTRTSPTTRGLRGKKKPTRGSEIMAQNEQPKRRSLMSLPGRSDRSLGMTSSKDGTRRRVPSNVNLSLLLQQDESVRSLKTEPQELSFSSHLSARRNSGASIGISLPGSTHRKVLGKTNSLDSTTSSSIDSFSNHTINYEEDDDSLTVQETLCNRSSPVGRQSIRVSLVEDSNGGGSGDGKSMHKTFEEMASHASKGLAEQPEEEFYEIEIYPGHFVPFHNSASVWKALARGKSHTMEYACLDCETTLVSVADCEHVICTQCKMVNPVFEWPAGVTPTGAGIGLKKEWIHQHRREPEIVVAPMAA